jgi:hypothetical protein
MTGYVVTGPVITFTYGAPNPEQYDYSTFTLSTPDQTATRGVGSLVATSNLTLIFGGQIRDISGAEASVLRIAWNGTTSDVLRITRHIADGPQGEITRSEVYYVALDGTPLPF